MFSRSLVLFAGLCAATATSVSERSVPKTPPKPKPQLAQDPRLGRLKAFFVRCGCPVRDLAEEFLRAADTHRLDWRLLPSLAYVESGGGRKFRNQNVFGWGNGKIPFRDVRSSIHIVAERLAHSPIYRRKKTVEAKLATYNPVDGYVSRVRAVMEQIAPSEVESRPGGLRLRPVSVAN